MVSKRLSNGFKDDSLIREKLGGEIFRNAGVKVARSAFYRVYVDIGDGNGATYSGLYTMVEDLSTSSSILNLKTTAVIFTSQMVRPRPGLHSLKRTLSKRP